MTPPAVELRKVSKSYREGEAERVVLRDVSVTIARGELQRGASARALIHGPALILADRPTGNLDAEAAADVLDLLDTLAREAGRAVLMVTHSREVVGVADRIFAIQRGALVERPR